MLHLGGSPRSSADAPWHGGRYGGATSSVDLHQITPASDVVVVGGEPTLRADLLTVLTQIRQAGPRSLTLATDGLALTSGGVIDALRGAGVGAVRIPLLAPQAEAHDWAVGRPGSAKRAWRAIRACAAAGLEVEVDLVVTRPSTHLLVELTELAIRLGAKRLRMRAVVSADCGEGWFVALAGRIGLIEPFLLGAVGVAKRAGVPVVLQDWPRCAFPGLGELPIEAPSGPSLSSCAQCTCTGMPSDYVAAFGWQEVHHGPPGAIPPLGAPIHPGPRGGRVPATRLAHLQAVRAVAEAPALLQVALAEGTDRRLARTRLVRCSQELPEVLRLGPEWAVHPDGGPLIVDAMRLGLPVVEVVVDPPGVEVVRRLVRRRPIPPTHLVLWLRGAWDAELVAQVEGRGHEVRLLEADAAPEPSSTHRWNDASGLVAISA